MTDLVRARPRRRLPAGLELLIPIAVALVIFAILNDNFLKPANLATVLMGIAFVGIVAVGQTVVVITGNFDLSVGANAALSAVVGATAMLAGVPVPLGVLIIFAVGLAVGAVNAFFTIIGMPSFIVTIATLFMAEGIAIFITKGQPVYPLPAEINAIGSARPLGVSVTFLVFLALVIGVSAWLKYSRTGAIVYAVGGSSEVASLIGFSTLRTILGAFLFSGATASLAGLLQMASLASASNTIGAGWELTSIAAVVIGGASIFGGTGWPVGTALGALLLGLVSNGLVSTGVQPNWQTLATGVIMIGAVSIDILRRRARRRRGSS